MSKSPKISLPPEFESELASFYQLASKDLESDETLSKQAGPILSNLETVGDHYTEKEVHEIGGMKVIWKANDLRTGRSVAMAEMKVHSDYSNEHAEQFLREARITAILEHPNIVPIYDIGINAKGKPFFTMKFMKDDNLKTVIRELVKANPLYTKQYSLSILLDIFLKVCDAIAFAHSYGVIHLDIKPSNVMIGNYGEVYICDWGLAKLLRSPDSNTSEIPPLDETILNDITLSGVVKGTPGYMAPEQIDKKFGKKNEKTDIYSLGALLYKILSFKRPYQGLDVDQTLKATTCSTLRPPQELSLKDIPESLNAICMKAMSKKQEERYDSVDDLITDIRSYQEGFVTEAENATLLKSLLLLFKRNRLFASLLSTFFLVSAVAVFSFMKHKRDRENQTNEIIMDKDHEIAQLKEKAIKKIEGLHRDKVNFRNTLIRERSLLRGIVKKELIPHNQPIIVNSSLKNLETISQPYHSSTVRLPDSPLGTTGLAMHLMEGDIFHTGVTLPEKFTISFWAKLPEKLKDHRLKVTTDHGGNDEVNFQIRDNGAVRFNTWEHRPNFVQSPPNTIKPNTWSHFTLAHQGKKKEMKLYIDGKLVAKATTDFSVESWGKVKLSRFGCFIDELRIWGKSHSDTEVAQNKDKLVPNTEELIAWFNFDHKSSDFLEENTVEPALYSHLDRSRRVLAKEIQTINVLDGYSFQLLNHDTLDTGLELPGLFTLSFWAKFPLDLKNDFLEIVTESDQHEKFDFKVTQNRGLYVSTYPNETNTISTEEKLIEQNKWTHFTIVHRGANEMLEVFVDGQLIGSTKADFVKKTWGPLQFTSYGCLLDEIRVWDRPLSVKEIKTNQQSTEPDVEKLTGWFSFNEEEVFKNMIKQARKPKLISVD